MSFFFFTTKGSPGMPQKIRDVPTPHGLGRLAFRAPIWLYRLGLGWLLGNRFLLLTHTGRKSGLPRQTVLEVVRYDKATGEYFVASGFGEMSDWFRNVMAKHQVIVQSGLESGFDAVAERLSPEEAEQELLDYANRHPTAMRELARFMGYQLENNEADIRALGRMIPILVLKPVEHPIT
jgi:deazaflavin-dependent oxidoreductase (nitroreductase family)